MVTDSGSAVLDHLAGRTRSDAAWFWRHHSFRRGCGSEVSSRSRCTLIFALETQALKVFVTTRNLEYSLGVDLSLGAISVPNLDLGAFHVEDQGWL